MTNAEKFEEVFGIKIDEEYSSGICQSIDHKICEEHNCPDCPAFRFWDKEYVERHSNNRWCNTCEFKHLESECLGCAEYDEYDNLIKLRNYKKEETK